MTKPRAKFRERRNAERLLTSLERLRQSEERPQEEIARFIERLRDINETRGEASEMEDLEMMAP